MVRVGRTVAASPVAQGRVPGLCRPRLRGLDLLESGHDFFHRRPALRIAGKTLQGELSCLESASGRVLPLEPGVHQSRQLAAVGEHRLRPVDQVVLPARAVRVEGPQTCEHFEKHHSEAIHITLYIQMSCFIKLNFKLTECFDQHVFIVPSC